MARRIPSRRRTRRLAFSQARMAAFAASYVALHENYLREGYELTRQSAIWARAGDLYTARFVYRRRGGGRVSTITHIFREKGGRG